ncbi:MAG: protein nirF [Polyangiaceae bacterium]|nr:protein nirF [Polyangiaceae bacterium]
MTLLRTHAIALGALAALACRQPTLASEPAPAASVSAAASAAPAPPPGGVGSRVFVVERETESLGVYDLVSRTYEPGRIRGLGNLRHAVMAFSPDLRWGYVATRSGKLSRVDLATLERAGDAEVSANSIDIAIGQDGRFVATAEYQPGGVTFLDASTLEVVERIPAEYERDGARAISRATGLVDAPGQRFVCVLIEGAEIWVIDASGPKPVVERRVRTSTDEPYDAMITPDGRWYVVGHLGSEHVTVLDLAASDPRPREVSLRDPSREFARAAPVKLPHLASWAVAGSGVFVPLVGEARMVVLDRDGWGFRRSIPVRGHPVYAVAAPSGREVWVSFSGAEHDAWIDVIDTTTLTVARSLRVGERIYHLDFTPRGSHVLVSANQAGRLALVDARTYAVVDEEPVHSPSGVFGAWRAFRIGL